MKNKTESSKKEIKKILKDMKNPKRLNCVATEKCQINLEQIQTEVTDND